MLLSKRWRSVAISVFVLAPSCVRVVLSSLKVLSGNNPGTIEPNVGVVSVPDDRLLTLAKINVSVKTVATSLEFVDIAGLVKGASKGSPKTPRRRERDREVFL